jgi:DivIVA domain-containing protein
MAATRLDHPVLVSGEQIRRREFVTTRRGYDVDQVRRYLEEIADQVDLMGSLIREARMEAETAARAGTQNQTDPYEQLARRVASVLREADDTAERLLTKGRLEADRLLTEARSEADRVRTDAQAQAERTRADAERALGEARAEADHAISGLATRRESLVDQLAQMQERLLGVARDLESTIAVPPEGATDDVEAPEVTDGESGVPVEVSGAAEPSEASAASNPDDEPVVVDVREEPHADESQAPSSPLIVANEAGSGAEPLWEGTDAIQLDLPDIPPLDLSWGDEPGADRD